MNRLVTTLALAMGLLLPVAAQTQSAFTYMATIPDPYGENLSHLAMAGPTADNKIYLIGGIPGVGDSCDSRIERTVREYDLNTNSFRYLPITLPYPYYSNVGNAAVLAQNGKIYVSPGNGCGGWGQHNRIIEIDLQANTAIERAQITGGNTWDNSMQPAPDGGIYVICGWNGGPDSAIRHYNPVTDTITTLASNFGSAVGDTLTMTDGRILLLGGNPGIRQITIFNPTDNSVKRITPNVPLPDLYWVARAWNEPSGKVAIFINRQCEHPLCSTYPSPKVTFDPVTETFEVGEVFNAPGVFQEFQTNYQRTKVYGFTLTPTSPRPYWENVVLGQVWEMPLTAPNQAPVLAAVGDQSTAEGQRIQFTLSATDPDGNALTYAASNLPTGATFDAATATFSWTPTFSQAGSYPNVLFTVTDAGNPPLSASEAITLSVGEVNRPPVMEAVPDKSVNEGQRLEFTIVASDPDGDQVAITPGNLPRNAVFNAYTNTFSWVPAYDQAGNYQVSFTATDSAVPASVASQSVNITVGNVNRPPVLSPIGNKAVDENQLLQFTVTGTDPDGDLLAFSAENLPEGAAFDSATHLFSWHPTFDQKGTYLDIEFTVTDSGSPIELASESIMITVSDVNRAPVFVPIGTQQTLENQLLTFSVQANDPDGNAIAYSVSNLPIGAAFDPSARVFTWVPNGSQAGNYAVTFTATDDRLPALASSLGVALVVGDVPTPCEMAAKLIDTVTGLRLRKAVENSYLANLKKVCSFVESGKITPAINQVEAFIHKVQIDLQNGDISTSAGTSLIDLANQLIAKLNP